MTIECVRSECVSECVRSVRSECVRSEDVSGVSV